MELRQQLIGDERVAGEDRVGADGAERDRRAGIAAERVLRGYRARDGRGHAERGGDHRLIVRRRHPLAEELEHRHEQPVDSIAERLDHLDRACEERGQHEEDLGQE